MSTDETRVRIDLPLPLDVAATLTKLIGAAYPSCTMEGLGRSLIFVIPAGARAKAVSKRAAKPVPAEGDTVLNKFSTDGTVDMTISTPEELAAACLDIMRTAFAEYPDAKNYLEQRLWDKKDNRAYAMTFQRVEGLTAHELRREAEDKIAAALQFHRKTQGFVIGAVCSTCQDTGGVAALWPCETAKTLGVTE